MKDFFTLVIQLVVLIASYILGTKQNKSEQIRASYKERYDNLYSPVVELIIKYHFHCTPLDTYNKRFTKKVFFVIYKNLKFIDIKSMRAFQEWHSYDPLEFDYTNAFISLIISILNESINIEKYLHYPLKSKFLLNNQELFPPES